MRLSWPVCRYRWEARLLCSRLGPLRLLGDLRHLAAGLLAWLTKLGGLDGLWRLSRLCGLARLGRLQGLTFRSGALGMGEKTGDRVRVCYAQHPAHNQPAMGPWAGSDAGHVLSARPTKGALTRW